MKRLLTEGNSKNRSCYSYSNSIISNPPPPPPSPDALRMLPGDVYHSLEIDHYLLNKAMVLILDIRTTINEKDYPELAKQIDLFCKKVSKERKPVKNGRKKNNRRLS